jgi:hypothetical protein
VISLSFNTSNYAAYQRAFEKNSYWSVSFLGIPIAGGSQSYHQATISYDSKSNTVTTMTPVGSTTPVAPTGQLANVVPTLIVWPSAAKK